MNSPVQQINPNKIETNKPKYEKGKLENVLSAAGFEKLQHISGVAGFCAQHRETLKSANPWLWLALRLY
jgi:hypothetical protein